MKKITKAIFLTLLIVVIILAIVYLLINISGQDSNDNQKIEEEITIETRFPDKLVYTVEVNENKMDRYKQHCESLGGEFNECGNICASEESICVQVCAYTCNLKKEENSQQYNWQNYRNENLAFSLLKPENLEVNIIDNRRVELQILGSSQKEETEITDGLRMIVARLSYENNISLKNFVENRVKEIEEVGDIVAPVALDDKYKLATYRYTVNTLGEFKHVVMPIYPGEAFDIGYFASDRNYNALAEKIIQSFNINDENKMLRETDKIKINYPKLGQTISSPLQIEGEARGNWFFENQFLVTLTDWDGRIIGEAIASSNEDWMTEDFIPFTAELEFEVPEEIYNVRANLIFQKSNPSGLPENSDSLEYLIYLNK